MASELDELLELARKKAVLPADREAQRLSFAYGNAKMSDARVTRDSIARAAAGLGQVPVTPSKK